MGIMIFQCIGLAHTVGDIVLTSSVTVDNGKDFMGYCVLGYFGVKKQHEH